MSDRGMDRRVSAVIRMLFVRHGATAGNLEKRYIGSTDEPLCEKGIAQIKALRTHSWKPDRLFVSPMTRTKQTADLLFPDVPQTVVKDFRETDFGMFEGRNAVELSAVPEYQAWVDNLCVDPIPQGESPSDFKARCCKAFGEVLPTIQEDSTAAFVVHGGGIMAILEAYARPQLGFYDYHIGNGDYLWCTYEKGHLHIMPAG